MSAISTTLLTLARAGDRVAAQRELYGGSVDLLERVLPGLGIEVVWLGREELNRLEPERIRGCGVLYLETPINPTLRLIDLERAVAAAREAGAVVAVDSTFATPILQRPIELGVDLVFHSTTKYLGGHNDMIGGPVLRVPAAARHADVGVTHDGALRKRRGPRRRAGAAPAGGARVLPRS